jgi:pimeloyl-ACP methyl ester carboxylesterase
VSQPIQSPPPWAVLAEGLFAWDMALSALRLPALARQPRGAGDPVLVLPGYAASDVSTALLRAYLRGLGHDARGWGLGRNHGDVARLVPQVRALAARRVAATGRRVRFVGWSLGGVVAREVARDAPELVENVVTMGSPIVGGPRYTAAARAYTRSGADLDAIERAIAERERTPIRVPITAIYSKRDGIVAWQACIDASNPDVEHVEVSSTHTGLGVHAEVLAIVAGRLATPARRRATGSRRAP